MHRPAILPLDPATPLIEIIRAAPPAESCGVWIGGTGAAAPEPLARAGASPGGGALLIRSDLGSLLRVVRSVVVLFEGRVVAVSSTVLALARMLEIVGDGPRLVAELDEQSPEAALAEARGGGRVTASRVQYSAVDVRPGGSLG